MTNIKYEEARQIKQTLILLENEITKTQKSNEFLSDYIISMYETALDTLNRLTEETRLDEKRRVLK